MKSTQDHSHGTNVINFEALIALCQSLGTRYNPNKDKQKLTYMQSRMPATKEIMRNLDKALTADTEARARRRILFENLPTLASRAVEMFAMCNIAADTVKSARGLLRKMRGKKLTTPKKKETEGGTTGGTTEVVHHEANQQSFMFMVQHFQQLIETISLATDYDPNELDLKMTALEAYLQKLKDANTETTATGTALDRARNNRDRDLYRDGDGLVKVAKEVKSYIRVVFGRESEASKEAHALLFVDYKFKELDAVLPDPA